MNRKTLLLDWLCPRCDRRHVRGRLRLRRRRRRRHQQAGHRHHAGDQHAGDGHADTGTKQRRRPPTLGAQIDRIGRPAVNTALNHIFDAERRHDGRGEGRVQPGQHARPTGARSTPPSRRANLAIFDSLDDNLRQPVPRQPGRRRAELERRRSTARSAASLADDRLWLDTAARPAPRTSPSRVRRRAPSRTRTAAVAASGTTSSTSRTRRSPIGATLGRDRRHRRRPDQDRRHRLPVPRRPACRETTRSAGRARLAGSPRPVARSVLALAQRSALLGCLACDKKDPQGPRRRREQRSTPQLRRRSPFQAPTDGGVRASGPPRRAGASPAATSTRKSQTAVQAQRRRPGAAALARGASTSTRGQFARERRGLREGRGHRRGRS